jgi:predicted metalloenzyme YecM
LAGKKWSVCTSASPKYLLKIGQSFYQNGHFVGFEVLIRQQADEFLTALSGRLLEEGILIEDHWVVDHLCYRTSSQGNYLQTKREFARFSSLLIESEVNGRLIATYKLHSPVRFHDWNIDIVEVPAPKAGKPTSEGFEHIEVVCDVSFDELQKKYGHLKLDTGGLQKKINPELEICLGERNIKFHHTSLEEVIHIEKQNLDG